MLGRIRLGDACSGERRGPTWAVFRSVSSPLNCNARNFSIQILLIVIVRIRMRALCRRGLVAQSPDHF